LVNDSNLDWNQALPDVEQWVERRGLTRVLLDEYAFSDRSCMFRRPGSGIASSLLLPMEVNGRWFLPA
jgi:hypothetical protein